MNATRNTINASNVMEAANVAKRLGNGVSSLGDKVLVNSVWDSHYSMFGGPRLSEFKAQLAKLDNVILCREDLIPQDSRLAAFIASEVNIGISSYHYVRVNALGGILA